MNVATVEEIEARRIKRKLPIAALCLRAGIMESTYRRWIRGLHSPRLDLLRAVAEALDAA